MEKQEPHGAALTPSEAWIDFMERVVPGIWKSLNRNERRDINSAQRDFQQKRALPSGKIVVFGPERIARLLDRFAPGQYVMEQTVVFWRVEG